MGRVAEWQSGRVVKSRLKVQRLNVIEIANWTKGMDIELTISFAPERYIEPCRRMASESL